MNEHSLIYMTKLYDEAMDLNTKLQKELENLKNTNEEHRVLNGVLREENKKLRDIINHIWGILDKGYFEDGCDCIKAYDYLQEVIKSE